EQMVKDRRIITDITTRTPPLRKNTVRLPELNERDFIIHSPGENGTITLNTMEMTPIGTTKIGPLEIQVTDGEIRHLPEEYVFATVTGRHGQNRKPFVGVLK
ncbi:hypothetical protein, partial [Virgibacillus salexigens]|uniref:hypothetical protein n=1 Tax=Virgibacillus salexigens TaxID=61016 RepID=UPI0019095251